MFLPVVVWRHPHFLFEHDDEIGGIIDSDFHGCRRDFHFGVFQKQVCRFFHSQPADMLLDSGFVVVVHHVVDGGFADGEDFGQGFDLQVILDMGVDVVVNLFGQGPCSQIGVFFLDEVAGCLFQDS